ncbi:MAG: putative phage abortive infection protein [Verrucomicrobiota bacterium]
MLSCAILAGNPWEAVVALVILAGALSVIILQKLELNIRKQELKETRDLFSQTRFEVTFFNLVSLHHERIRALEIYQNIGPNIQGRSCFNYIYYKSFVLLYGSGEDVYAHLPPLERAQTYYHQLHSIYESDLSYYFRNLYHILHFVNSSRIHPKWPYIQLLRAQLSSPELLLLFYHALSPHDNNRLKPFIEKYGLLANMPVSSLLSAKHKELYAESAFQDPLSQF